MILMSVISPMRKNQVWLNTPLQGLEPALEFIALLGKEAVPKSHCFDLSTSRFRQKVIGRRPRLPLTLTCSAKNAPMHIKANTTRQQTQERRSGADLDVIRVRTKAENGQTLSRRRELKSFHEAATARTSGVILQGISPRSIISSRTCRSLSVSIARQKPSYL